MGLNLINCPIAVQLSLKKVALRSKAKLELEP